MSGAYLVTDTYVIGTNFSWVQSMDEPPCVAFRVPANRAAIEHGILNLREWARQLEEALREMSGDAMKPAAKRGQTP